MMDPSASAPPEARASPMLIHEVNTRETGAPGFSTILTPDVEELEVTEVVAITVSYCV